MAGPDNTDVFRQVDNDKIKIGDFNHYGGTLQRLLKVPGLLNCHPQEIDLIT